VLMINMFNEKIFLFLWFWFFMVSIVSFFSMAHWMLMSFFPGQHMKFVRRYLRATDLATDRQSVKKFVHKFLGTDGVFCMRMISAHAGDIMATELIVALWQSFNDRVRKSPIEMFEGGVGQSPTKMETGFKSWLSNNRKPMFEGSNTMHARGGRKRRKSDGYFTFV